MSTSFGAGIIVAKISGEAVRISGEAVRVSGEAVRVSGEAVRISGEVVLISGQPVTTTATAPTIYRTARTVVPNTSGGTNLGSGTLVAATHRAHPANSGDIFTNASGQAASGVGFLLRPNDAQSVAIDNFNRVFGFATVSGDVVLSFGVA